MVWHGMVWYEVEWYGIVWFGMKWNGMWFPYYGRMEFLWRSYHSEMGYLQGSLIPCLEVIWLNPNKSGIILITYNLLRIPHDIQYKTGGLYCPPQVPAGFLRIPEDSWGLPGLNIGRCTSQLLESCGGIFLRTGDSPDDFQTGLVPGLLQMEWVTWHMNMCLCISRDVMHPCALVCWSLADRKSVV